MPDYVFNPRRSPRAPVRCQAQVVTAQGSVQAETEDVGMRGVQVVTPRQLRAVLQPHKTRKTKAKAPDAPKDPAAPAKPEGG